MPVLVKALGYYSHKGGKEARGVSKLKAHLKYLEFGKEHPNEPHGFSSKCEEMTRAEFLAEIQTQPERGVIAHKLVFSLSQNERDELGIDMRKLVRATMDDWSSRVGRPLKWIAFEHMDSGHPHVHVVVAGYAAEKQVGVYERDLAALRRSTEREVGRQVDLERLAPSKGEQQSMQRELERMGRQLEAIRSRGQVREPERSHHMSRDSGWDRGR